MDPFVYHDHTYATDRRWIIRIPGRHPDAAVPPAERERFLNSAETQFEWFANPSGDLVGFDTLTGEPVMERELVVSAPIDTENPGMNAPEERWVLRGTAHRMHERLFDRRRLLYVRQWLPKPFFYDEPEAGPKVPLRFVFGDNAEGQGLIMGLTDE